MTMHERLPAQSFGTPTDSPSPSPFLPDLRPARLQDAAGIHALHHGVVQEYFPEPAAAAKVRALYPLELWHKVIKRSLFRHPHHEGSDAEPEEAFDYLCRVAVLGDDILGYAILDAVKEEQPTLSIYVRADWRRCGLGRRMFNNMLHAAYRRGMFVIRLNVLEQQTGFFARMGCTLAPHADVSIQTLAEGVEIRIRPMIKLIGQGSGV